MSGTGVGHDHAGGERRVVAELQGELHRVIVAVGGRGAADDDPAVGHGVVLGSQGVRVDERHRGVVVDEVVGHRHDRLLHLVGVGAVGQHHETVAGVLLPGGQFRTFAATGSRDRVRRRVGVLHAGGHAVHATHRVGVPLAEAPTPERVGGTLGQDRLTDQPIDREQAGVPSGGDHRGGVVVPGGRIDRREVLGDPGMGVVAVDDVEHRGQQRPLHRQVLLRTATAQHDVDQDLEVGDVVEVHHRGLRVGRRHRGRVPPGDHSHQLQVGALADRRLRPPPEVAVAGDCDPDRNAHGHPSCGPTDLRSQPASDRAAGH